MNLVNVATLQALVAKRRLGPAKKLTFGQLRIATVPSIVRPERAGVIDPKWLQPQHVGFAADANHHGGPCTPAG